MWCVLGGKHERYGKCGITTSGIILFLESVGKLLAWRLFPNEMSIIIF